MMQNRAFGGRSPSRQSMVLAAATTGVILVSLDVSVVNVAIHALQRSFRTGINDLQWIISLYTLAYAVFLLSAGALSDCFGPRFAFLSGSVVFTLSSLACGTAPSLSLLLIGRAVQGVGAALLVPSSMAILQLAYPEAVQRARAVGLWAGAGSLALAAGPLVGGALIDVFGWRIIFLINVPIGAIGVWLTLRYAPRAELTRSRGVDLAGQIAATLTLGCLIFTLIETGSGHLDGVWTISGCLLSGAFLLALLVIELRTREPMIPLSIFQSRMFTIATGVGMVINFVFYGLIFVFSLFFQSVQHRSAFDTGVVFLPMTALIMLINILAGRLIGRLGVRPILLGGLSVAACGYGAMLCINATTTYIWIIPSFAAAGVGIALTIPAVMTVALDNGNSGRTGIAAGILNASRQVGGAIGVAAFGSIVSAAGNARFVQAMHLSVGVAAFLLAVACLAVLTVIPARVSS